MKTIGKKLRRFRQQRPATKQRTMMELGTFPSLSLADPPGLRADCLALLGNEIAPKIQAEDAEEHQQIALDSIFQRSPQTCSSSKAKALPLITLKIYGAHWKKTYSLPSGRFLSSKSKTEHWLKPLS